MTKDKILFTFSGVCILAGIGTGITSLAISNSTLGYVAAVVVIASALLFISFTSKTV